MKAILQNWLFECLKIKLDMENLGNELKDGVLLGNLLKHYGVANEKALKHILSSDDPKVCEYNLNQLRVWFNFLEIKFENETIENIVNGKMTTCLKLLYELFLALHDNKHLKFINFENHKKKLWFSEKKFSCKSLKYDKKLSDHQITGLNEQSTTEVAINQRTICSISKPKKSITNKEALLNKIRLEDIQFVRNELKNISTILKKKHETLPAYEFLLKDIHAMNELMQNEEVVSSKTFSFITKDSEIIPSLPITESKSFTNLPSDAKPLSGAETVQKPEHDELKAQILQNTLQQSEYEKQLITSSVQVGFLSKIHHEKVLEIAKSKDEASTNYFNFFSSCKTSEEEISYQLNLINRMELHRKLYDEKIRKRNKKHQSICQQIVKDLLDLAIKISEYGQKPVPTELISQWKQSFIMGEPILEDENVVINDDISVIEINAKYEDQEVLKDLYFDNYNHLIGDWFVYAGLDVSYDSLIIIAHIVYRLQNATLPPVIPLKPADIPKYRITSVLNGTFDELTLTKLHTLLFKSKICIVDIESVINSCIERYKLEADIKPEIIPSKKDKKSKEKSKPQQTDASKKKTAKSAGVKAPVIPANKDEEVQTTASLLENVDKLNQLSRLAEIGKQLYGIKTLTDISVDCLIDMLIEFLKSQSDIEGWLLVNYPTTLNEAYNLEKVLSGKKFPHVFHIMENETEQLNNSSTTNQSSIVAKNILYHPKLVYLPEKKPEEFKTYFTSFINVLKQEETNVSQTHTGVSSDSYVFEEGEEEAEEEEVPNLTKIYRSLGILKELHFENMDFNSLKNLAHIILQNDDNVEKVPSTEAFGESVIQYFEKPSSAMTESSEKKAKMPPKSKKTPKGKDELTALKEFLEELKNKTAAAALESESLSTEEQEETPSETVLMPGEDEWKYAKFPIPEEFETKLAYFWKDIEMNYIKTIKEVLFIINENKNMVTPYLNFITKTLNESWIEDIRQGEKAVKDFILYFNISIETCLLNDKAEEELLSKFFKLERSLWEIIDKKRNEMEAERQHIINKNWTADELIEIGKNYMLLMETETERCNATLQFLCEYFCLMSSIQPFIIPNVQLTNMVNLQFNRQEAQNTIAKMLVDPKEMHFLNPIGEMLVNATEHYLTEISQLKNKFNNIVEICRKCVIDKKNEHEAMKDQERIKNTHQYYKLKSSKSENKSELAIPDVLKASDSDIFNMFLEWNDAVKSELDRYKWRLKIIKMKGCDDLENLEKHMTCLFHKLHDEVIQDYIKENECINDLCKLFHSAISSHSPIIGDVITEGSCIYLEKGYDELSMESLESQIKPWCFTMEQLEYIAKHLKAAAPTGIIGTRIFRFILEDLIFHENLAENISPFPKGWNKLSTVNLNKLFIKAFGISQLIYWKDFILYCLDIHFPEIEDIVEYKEQFLFYDKETKGGVSRDIYSTMKFWYEENSDYPDSENYNKSVKEFIFWLFKNKENEFNYMDFLLHFSKAVNSTSGFGKALASLLGKSIIVSDENAYLESVLIEYNDFLSKMIREILDEVIIKMFNDHFILKIEELEEEIEEEHDANSKRGSKLTEIESLHSAEMEEEEDQRKQSKDKASQTISMTELINDNYIAKHKLWKWTSQVPSRVVNYLLKKFVFPVLSDVQSFPSKECLKQDIKESINRLEKDGILDVPSLMEEASIHSLFLCTNLFQGFSFSSVIKGMEGNKCNLLSH